MYFYTLSVFSLPFIPFDCHFYDCSNSISYREIEPGCDIMSTRMKIPTSTSIHSSLCKFTRKEKAMFFIAVFRSYIYSIKKKSGIWSC